MLNPSGLRRQILLQSSFAKPHTLRDYGIPYSTRTQRPFWQRLIFVQISRTFLHNNRGTHFYVKRRTVAPNSLVFDFNIIVFCACVIDAVFTSCNVYYVSLPRVNISLWGRTLMSDCRFFKSIIILKGR